MPYHEALLYIHILVALMLFALGIPTLIVEVSAEEQIKHILHKRLPYRAVTVLMIVTIGVIVSLLAVARPETKNDEKHLLLSKNESAIRPLRAIKKVPPEARSAISTTTAKISYYYDVAAVTVDGAAKTMVAILVIAFAGVWWRMMKHDMRGQLVLTLQKNVIGRYVAQGNFADRDIRDLIALGAYASAGYDKRRVTVACLRICEGVQEASRYSGTELSPLIYGLREIFSAPAKQADEANFIDVLETLRSVWAHLHGRLRDESDARATIDVVCWVGEYAVREGLRGAALHTLDVVSDDIEVPFRIGCTALDRRQFDVAVACLSRLESLGEKAERLPKELVALLAYFCIAGHSAAASSQRTRDRLTDVIVRDAAIEFYELGDFVTADVLQDFSSSLRGTNHSRSASMASGPLVFGLLALAGTLLVASNLRPRV